MSIEAHIETRRANKLKCLIYLQTNIDQVYKGNFSV